MHGCANGRTQSFGRYRQKKQIKRQIAETKHNLQLPFTGEEFVYTGELFELFHRFFWGVIDPDLRRNSARLILFSFVPLLLEGLQCGLNEVREK